MHIMRNMRLIMKGRIQTIKTENKIEYLEKEINRLKGLEQTKQVKDDLFNARLNLTELIDREFVERGINA